MQVCFCYFLTGPIMMRATFSMYDRVSGRLEGVGCRVEGSKARGVK